MRILTLISNTEPKFVQKSSGSKFFVIDLLLISWFFINVKIRNISYKETIENNLWNLHWSCLCLSLYVYFFKSLSSDKLSVKTQVLIGFLLFRNVPEHAYLNVNLNPITCDSLCNLKVSFIKNCTWESKHSIYIWNPPFVA